MPLRLESGRLGVLGLLGLRRDRGIHAVSGVWVAGAESLAPMIRQPRTRRRRGVRIELTERDGAVLQALNRFRLARTSHLCSYAFAGVRRDTAAVRLRRLFDAKYLGVLGTGPMAENLYKLGPHGRRFILSQGGTVWPVPRGGFQHHLAVVSAWIRLALNPDFELARCLADWELRRELKLGEVAVIPDLFALLRVGEAILPMAVEVDCGTEPEWILRSKAERYAALWGRAPGLFGWERFVLAVSIEAPERRALITSALKKVWVVPHAFLESEQSSYSALLQLLPQVLPPLTGTP